MNIVEIDNKLETSWPDEYTFCNSKRNNQSFFPTRTVKKDTDLKENAKTILLHLIQTPSVSEERSWKEVQLETLSKQFPSDGYLYHSGYLRYLEICWKDHIPAVISPDIIWHMILCELTCEVKSKPEKYATLFTTTPEQKQWILVPTEDVTTIDVNLIVDRLKDCVPTNSDLFLPKFTTTTDMSTSAFYVAFADLVSPYYNYGTFLCGIPKIKVLGETKDWNDMIYRLTKLIEVFNGHEKVVSYLETCRLQIMAINDNDKPEFWKTIVKFEICGSGSQYEISGWIMNFLMSVKKKVQLEGLPPHISKMNWVNIDTNRTFVLKAGLNRSKVIDGFLVPEFNNWSFETFPSVKK